MDDWATGRAQPDAAAALLPQAPRRAGVDAAHAGLAGPQELIDVRAFTDCTMPLPR